MAMWSNDTSTSKLKVKVSMYHRKFNLNDFIRDILYALKGK